MTRLDRRARRQTKWFRVGGVVPFEEEDESPFVGLLQVESLDRYEAD